MSYGVVLGVDSQSLQFQTLTGLGIRMDSDQHGTPNTPPIYTGPAAGIRRETLAAQLRESFERNEARDHETIVRNLLADGKRPRLSDTLFIAVESVEPVGLLTFQPADALPRNLLLFSTPLRAATYLFTLFGSEKGYKYLCVSASDCAENMRGLRESGVPAVAVDVCPHCRIILSLNLSDWRSTEDVLRTWAILTATRLVLQKTYLDAAHAAVKTQQYQRARDILLEIVEHVHAEEPVTHLMIGECALHLGDRRLLSESYAFLELLDPNAVTALQDLERRMPLG